MSAACELCTVVAVVQTVAYLLAHKLLAPSKFYLLRGNHELRPVQRMFQFHAYVFYCRVFSFLSAVRKKHDTSCFFLTKKHNRVKFITVTIPV